MYSSVLLSTANLIRPILDHSVAPDIGRQVLYIDRNIYRTSEKESLPKVRNTLGDILPQDPQSSGRVRETDY